MRPPNTATPSSCACWRPCSTVRRPAGGPAPTAAGGSTTGARVPAQLPRAAPTRLPGPRCAAETVRSYTTTARRLAIVSATVLADIGAGGGLAGKTSTGELQRLIPIERQLNHMQNEVQEVISAIAQVGNSESITRRLCLTQGPRSLAADGDDDSALASAILKAYETKLHSAQARGPPEITWIGSYCGAGQIDTNWAALALQAAERAAVVTRCRPSPPAPCCPCSWCCARRLPASTRCAPRGT